MKQIFLRSVPANDFFLNIFYKIRFWFYRNFWKSKLSCESPREKDEWELSFEDDFDKVTWGNSDNHERWIVGQGWDPYISGAISYPGPPELVKGTSHAKFTTKYNSAMIADASGNNFLVPFQSSVLSSTLNFKQNHGRFECKCTIPHVKGSWPAFWLWGSTWPPEIDVFEMWGGKDGKNSAIQWVDLHYNMHLDGSHDSIPKWGIRVENENENNWHHFAIEWYEDKIQFFTDEIKIYQYTGKEVLDKFFNVETAKMWIVINSGADPKVLGENETTYHSEFLVDYIRAYKKT